MPTKTRRNFLRNAAITAAIPLFVTVEKASAAVQAIGRAVGVIEEDPAWEYYMAMTFPNGRYGQIDLSLPKYDKVRWVWGRVFGPGHHNEIENPGRQVFEWRESHGDRQP